MAGKMGRLDTQRKFYVQRESPIEQMIGSVEVHRLKNGHIELICQQSVKKVLGKKWHTESVFLTLPPEPVQKLKKALG